MTKLSKDICLVAVLLESLSESCMVKFQEAYLKLDINISPKVVHASTKWRAIVLCTATLSITFKRLNLLEM